MATCQFCMPWNAPLMMRPKRLPTGESVPLSFDGWLWYYLHIVVHQQGDWAGEIEQYAAALRPSGDPISIDNRSGGVP